MTCVAMLACAAPDASAGTVAYKSRTCGQTPGGQTITLARPSGTTSGDLLLASIAWAKGGTTPTPAGWTQAPNLRGSVDGGNLELVTYYRVAGAGEPGSYTFTASSSSTDTASGSLTAWSGADQADPIATSPQQILSDSLTTTDTLPNATGLAPGSMRYSAVGADDGANHSFSTGMTLDCNERNETGVDASLGTGHEPTGTGTTATRTVTRDDDARSVLQTLVINPECSRGGLTVLAPPSTTFQPQTLDGYDGTTTATTTFRVNDLRSTGAGWKLSATSTRFDNGSRKLASTATTILGVTPAAVTGRCSAPSNTVPLPVTLPAGDTPPTAVPLFNAGTTTGEGPTDLTFNARLAYPANTRSGTYTSTWTVTLASGP